MARTVTTTLGLHGAPANPLLSELAKYLQVRVNSAALAATNVSGVVFEAPAGSDICGSRIGEFTNEQFEGDLDIDGYAVLKVSVGYFGGSTLTTSDTPVALVRNATKTTGIIDATIIEE